VACGSNLQSQSICSRIFEVWASLAILDGRGARIIGTAISWGHGGEFAARMTNLMVASQDFLSKRSWKKLGVWWHEERMANGRHMLEVGHFILPLPFANRQ